MSHQPSLHARTLPTLLLCAIVSCLTSTIGCSDHADDGSAVLESPSATEPGESAPNGSGASDSNATTVAANGTPSPDDSQPGMSDLDAPSSGNTSTPTSSPASNPTSSSPTAPTTSNPEIQIPQSVRDAPIRRVIKRYDNEQKTPHQEFEAKVFDNNSVMYHGGFREYRLDGSKFKEGKYEYGKKTGPWAFFNAKGKVVKKGSYDNDNPDGEWHLYRNDGTAKWIERYKNGAADGKWVGFRDDGKTRMWERNYKGGERNGDWKEFQPDGKTLLIEDHYLSNERHGPHKQWYENGQIALEGAYQHGKKHGLFKTFDTHGNLRNSVRYEEDRPKGSE